MPIFLTDSEHQSIQTRLAAGDPLFTRFADALRQRVAERVGWGSLLGPESTTAWYYPAAEYLSDAAMHQALWPDEAVANWLRTVTLDIVRKPAFDWVGPAFRDHTEPLMGHLETAHLCWGIASVLDLAGNVFSENEQTEIRQALAEKGITLCQRWVAKNHHLANWRGILVSGIVVAAAALGDSDTLDATLPDLRLCHEAFQPDGSYGESLQYGNYLAFALMLAHEAVVRSFPEKAKNLDVSAYGRGISWVASSLFYAKSMGGIWGDEPRARAANFNDSAATFRPSGDLLLHLALRGDSETDRGLARWLFQTHYESCLMQGPHDLATFGMVNDWGFLTIPFLTHELPSALSPKAARLPLVNSFSNGNAFVRDSWDSKTILALNGGGDPLCGPGHLHGDLGSFILVHNQERLLTDPGHSCYRNLIHGLESSSQTHNTCTFLVEKEGLGLQEDLAKTTLLEQKSVLPRRLIHDGKPGSPVNRGNRKLIAERDDVVAVIGAEIGAAYGSTIQQFSRLWLLAGSHVLFVVDTIAASQPVTTVWNWLVNNRDGQTQAQSSDSLLTIRRHGAGLKLWAGGSVKGSHPVYGYVHDAYHVEPAQRGEGRPGSGLVFRFTEKTAQETRTVVHAIALDAADALDAWGLQTENGNFTLSNGVWNWTLRLPNEANGPLTLTSGHGRAWAVRQTETTYQLSRL
ncbi:MAG: heparinase II/III family protein [Cytophagaceae bacterium]|nr:heparinase II/III family protein [Cytophagaceae bacterium]